MNSSWVLDLNLSGDSGDRTREIEGESEAHWIMRYALPGII